MEIAESKPQVISKKKRRIIPTRRERWAWYLYDFGNSAYAAVVLLAVYSAYFKQSVVGGAEGSRLWGLSIGIAMLVVALLSPVLGAIADFSGTKKRLLFVFTSMACIFTALLFFVQKGDVFIGMLFFILAEIGYRSGQVFYNALLPEIAEPEDMGRVSGNGWAIGSAGGIVCLLIVLALIMTIGGPFITRLAFLITALFYGLSTFPLFLFLRERSQPNALPKGHTYFSVAIGKLWSTFKSARKYKEFGKFLASFMIFNNGIMITLDFAAIIGAVLFSLTQQQLIIFMIIVQITSVIGAFAFGRITQKVGSKTTLIISLLLMCVAVGMLFFVKSLAVFNVIGALAGFALTGVQSVSRTAVGQLAPEEKATEFYVVSQLTNFVGPTLYGMLVASLAIFYGGKGFDALHAEEMGLRVGVVAIITFLLIGLGLLFTVKKWHRPEESE